MAIGFFVLGLMQSSPALVETVPRTGRVAGVLERKPGCLVVRLWAGQNSSVEMRDRVRRTSDGLYAAWNVHDADAVAAVYAEDAEFFDVVSGITMKSRDAIRGHVAGCFAGFGDFSVARRMLLIDGRTGADQWVMQGTHTGEYQGVPATGNTMEVAGATFSEYDEQGLVICATNYVDVPAFLRQLGLG